MCFVILPISASKLCYLDIGPGCDSISPQLEALERLCGENLITTKTRGGTLSYKVIEKDNAADIQNTDSFSEELIPENFKETSDESSNTSHSFIPTNQVILRSEFEALVEYS